MVRPADGICARIGISPLAPQEMGPAALQSVQVLGVEDEQLEYLVLQLEALCDQLGDLL